MRWFVPETSASSKMNVFCFVFFSDAGVVIPTFSVHDLLPQSQRFDYFRYQGSLTTPPCHESVIWSIGTDLIEISEKQVVTHTRSNEHSIFCRHAAVGLLVLN